MAKNRPAQKKKKPTERGLSKSQHRRAIARLDQQLVDLINHRGRLAEQLSAAGEKPDIDSDLQQLARLVEKSAGPVSDAAMRSIMSELMSGCRALMKPVQIACLGPRYSYSHLATRERFGEAAELHLVASIGSVFEEVQLEQADFGVVPIENSTDGRVVDSLEMFSRHSVRICGEIQLRIHHNLLGKCKREDIREVHSKPQALSQCRLWLARHLPSAKAVETASTAAAAKKAATSSGVAAIASREAGLHNGLDVIAGNIEDNRDNITRFGVIRLDQETTRTGADKTALMFELPHQPGALADAMAIFKRYELNLTWIESFPIVGSANEYRFFVEFEGHQVDPKAAKALRALQAKTVRLDILGSYARSAPVG